MIESKWTVKDEEFIEYPFKQKEFYINKVFEDNDSRSNGISNRYNTRYIILRIDSADVNQRIICIWRVSEDAALSDEDDYDEKNGSIIGNFIIKGRSTIVSLIKKV